jgi:hypothetical protein
MLSLMIELHVMEVSGYVNNSNDCSENSFNKK